MNNSYSGIVRHKYIGSRRSMFMEISDQSFEGKEYYIHNTNLYDAMDSGDFVYKNKGTLKMYLVKGKDSLYYYPQCGEHEVRFGD